MLTGFRRQNIYGDIAKCDEELGEKVKQSTNAEELMSKFVSIITATCDAAFKVSRARFEIPRGKVFLGGTVNSRFFEKERLPLEEGTKGLGMMTTCDKRGSSCTRSGSDTIR